MEWRFNRKDFKIKDLCEFDCGTYFLCDYDTVYFLIDVQSDVSYSVQGISQDGKPHWFSPDSRVSEVVPVGIDEDGNIIFEEVEA